MIRQTPREARKPISIQEIDFRLLIPWTASSVFEGSAASFEIPFANCRNTARMAESENVDSDFGCSGGWAISFNSRASRSNASAIRGAVVPRHMTLAELARLARKAKCVVGVDTGLAHLAVALGVPVVGLYGGSDPALTGLYASGIAGEVRVRSIGGIGKPPAEGDALAALEALGMFARSGAPG